MPPRWLFPLVILSIVRRVLVQDPALGPASSDPACLNPPMDQCTFYANCLESRYHCGPNGYPLGYGQYLCQKFSANRDLFDARGQQWMVNAMHCLQLALVGDATDATPAATTCQALTDQAYASHVGCYIHNGFCTLGVRDWVGVLEILNITTLVSSWDAFKTTVETGRDCAAFDAYMVEMGLF